MTSLTPIFQGLEGGERRREDEMVDQRKRRHRFELEELDEDDYEDEDEDEEDDDEEDDDEEEDEEDDEGDEYDDISELMDDVRRELEERTQGKVFFLGVSLLDRDFPSQLSVSSITPAFLVQRTDHLLVPASVGFTAQALSVGLEDACKECTKHQHQGGNTHHCHVFFNRYFVPMLRTIETLVARHHWRQAFSYLFGFLLFSMNNDTWIPRKPHKCVGIEEIHRHFARLSAAWIRVFTQTDQQLGLDLFISPGERPPGYYRQRLYRLLKTWQDETNMIFVKLRHRYRPRIDILRKAKISSETPTTIITSPHKSSPQKSSSSTTSSSSSTSTPTIITTSPHKLMNSTSSSPSSSSSSPSPSPSSPSSSSPSSQSSTNNTMTNESSNVEEKGNLSIGALSNFTEISSSTSPSSFTLPVFPLLELFPDPDGGGNSAPFPDFEGRACFELQEEPLFELLDQNSQEEDDAVREALREIDESPSAKACEFFRRFSAIPRQIACSFRDEPEDLGFCLASSIGPSFFRHCIEIGPHPEFLKAVKLELTHLPNYMFSGLQETLIDGLLSCVGANPVNLPSRMKKEYRITDPVQLAKRALVAQTLRETLEELLKPRYYENTELAIFVDLRHSFQHPGLVSGIYLLTEALVELRDRTIETVSLIRLAHEVALNGALIDFDGRFDEVPFWVQMESMGFWPDPNDPIIQLEEPGFWVPPGVSSEELKQMQNEVEKRRQREKQMMFDELHAAIKSGYIQRGPPFPGEPGFVIPEKDRLRWCQNCNLLEPRPSDLRLFQQSKSSWKEPVERHRKCGRCRKALYCSRACQREDWPNHKKVCVPFQSYRPTRLPSLSLRSPCTCPCAVCAACPVCKASRTREFRNQNLIPEPFPNDHPPIPSSSSSSSSSPSSSSTSSSTLLIEASPSSSSTSSSSSFSPSSNCETIQPSSTSPKDEETQDTESDSTLGAEIPSRPVPNPTPTKHPQQNHPKKKNNKRGKKGKRR